MKKRLSELPLRSGVGIVVLNNQNKVFVAKRIDNPKNFWQMPQGGVDEGENFLNAAYRELEEETSIKKVKLIQELEGTITYELPDHLLGIIWKGKYRGQKQKWFLMRYLGKDQEIDLNTTNPEFFEWKWIDLDMITRFESDRINLEIEENNIVEICQDIFDSLELKAREKNISISYGDNYDNPIMVKCDSDRIAQVMQNLIINAINYSDPDTEVVVRFTNIERNILIEIEDNGPGIAEKHISRLFERFYRVDKSRARNEGGTGLGLSIVKHIIEAHGHTVQVRSKEGKGSNFFFTLTKN